MSFSRDRDYRQEAGIRGKWSREKERGIAGGSGSIFQF